MIYTVRFINYSSEIDVWARDEWFIKQYLKHELAIHRNHNLEDYAVETWHSYHEVPYEINPSKELIIVRNLVGESYLITKGKYVGAINYFATGRHRNIKGELYIPAEEVSTTVTILGALMIFSKNNYFREVIREIRKQEWKIDPFTYQSRKTNIRKRKLL